MIFRIRSAAALLVAAFVSLERAPGQDAEPARVIIIACGPDGCFVNGINPAGEIAADPAVRSGLQLGLSSPFLLDRAGEHPSLQALGRGEEVRLELHVRQQHIGGIQAQREPTVVELRLVGGEKAKLQLWNPKSKVWSESVPLSIPELESLDRAVTLLRCGAHTSGSHTDFVFGTLTYLRDGAEVGRESAGGEIDFLSSEIGLLYGRQLGFADFIRRMVPEIGASEP